MTPLPATAEEVKAIAAIYQEAQILLGDQMTGSGVRVAARGKDVLHFATHGVLNTSHPLFSGLVLSDGVLAARDIFSLNLGAALVVLSACNTAQGKISEGDELVSLSRAFMYAGSPAVVATLWSVSDESTACLMKLFYQNMKNGETAAAALQSAQCRILQDYPQPFYWAPFIFIGRY